MKKQKEGYWYCDYCKTFHSDEVNKYKNTTRQFCSKWLYLGKEEE